MYNSHSDIHHILMVPLIYIQGPNLAGIDVPRETSQPNSFSFSPALLI